MMDTKPKQLISLNAGLFIALLVIIWIIFKLTGPLNGEKREIISPKRIIDGGRTALSQQSDKARYDISEIKKPDTVEKRPVKSVNDIYANFSREDAGDNIVEAWARVNPEDKAKLTSGIDKQIEAAEKALKVNPEDKQAKNLLAVSRGLKKLISCDFNLAAISSGRVRMKDIKRK